MVLDDGVLDGEVVVAREGLPPGEQFVQDRPEGPQVRPVVHFLALDLFGRHVGRGAQDAAGLGQLRGVHRP